MDKKIKLRVQSITNSLVHSGAYALMLGDENGDRRIPIIVGTAEAQSIAIVMENIQPPRPLTHDLFADFISMLHVELCEVFIYKFDDGVFFSELVFKEGDRLIKLDSRTSDAIAIALRVKCPIYTSVEIMEKCGIHVEEGVETYTDDQDGQENPFDEIPDGLEPKDFDDEEQMQVWLERLSTSELNNRLNEAIDAENYEYAKIYKDELFRREKQK